jgi:signal transduction histidine kinase
VRSFATSLAVRQTLIAALLLAGLFYFTFLLTRWFLWQSLKMAGATEHARIMDAGGEGLYRAAPADITAQLRQISPTIPSQFYVEFSHADHGRLYATPNLRRATLASPSRTDNVYVVQVSGQGSFYVQTFRNGPLIMRIGQDLDAVGIILGAYTRASVVLFVAVLAVNGFLVWRAARHALRPVRAMQQAAERISSENLGERIAVGPEQNEIAALGLLLNRTFDRLQASFEQIRRFTADASHELRTPLTVARAHAEKLLQPDLHATAQEEAAHGLLVELTQLEQIIEDLLLLARSDAHALPFAVQEMVTEEFWAEVLPEVQALAEFHRIRLEARRHGQVRVRGDRRWLRHVVLNLVNNAIRHSPPAGRLIVDSSVADSLWRVIIEDEGSGVPPEKLERIFERFYQVRPDEKQVMEGTGLGLAICRSLVLMHHGSIRAENCAPGHGLRVVIELPAGLPGRAQAPAVSAAGSHQPMA